MKEALNPDCLKNRCILVTGGTGTFGQAFIKEALKWNPRVIRVFSRSESRQAEMQREFNDDRLRFLVGDVRDKERLDRAFNQIDIVIHAAALKRVETCEYNPQEAHKTNIDGSENVVNAAIDNMVDRVLAISSDKAVHPLNTYGVTKAYMEKIILGGDVYSAGKVMATRFSCIRSGNFELSTGNVLELWRQEAEKGEITVTNPAMSRYWIKVEKLAELAIEFLLIMQGHEVFVPKMQEVTLTDLIKSLGKEVKLNIVGKRPGEKMKELLFNEDEQPEDEGEYWIVRKERQW